MNFADRLRQIVHEYGSRYALAKATGIPASTLQSYEAGSNPGMDALVRLARIANVDLDWLLTGRGKIRPSGLVPGAVLSDVLMVDQYQIGTALSSSIIIGQVPFSRHLLESKARLENPHLDTLLTVESDQNLLPIARGDIVLIDRTDKQIERDGIYLLDLPGIALRALVRRPGSRVAVLGPELEVIESSDLNNRGRRSSHIAEIEVPLHDLVGVGRRRSKIAGRVVWINRGL